MEVLNMFWWNENETFSNDYAGKESNYNYINSICQKGGLVAGDPKIYELRGCGSVQTITNPAEVQRIDKLIEEAIQFDADIVDYLNFYLQAGD